MLNKVYVMYDKVSMQFGPPIIGINDLSMRREFLSMIKSDILSKNEAFLSKKSDMVIYSVGSYNTDTGEIKPSSIFQCYTVLELYNEVIAQIELENRVKEKNNERKKE